MRPFHPADLEGGASHGVNEKLDHVGQRFPLARHVAMTQSLRL